jgi:ABC-2 type transport system ATP-binding protein
MSAHAATDLTPRTARSSTPLVAASAMTSDAIRTEQLTKRYGRTLGLDAVDLEVPAGCVFGFLGPNGAGKTTTIRLLLDLIRPTGGRASVLGFDCQRHSLEVRRRVGYLPGELALYDTLTGAQTLGHLAHLRGGVPPGRVAELASLLDVDLARPVRALSKGNRQKIGVIAAFMGDPELLVLDEPTSGVDPLVQQTVHGLIRSAAGEGRTVFLSSHILPEVQLVADMVGIVREGRVIAVEQVDELRARAVRRVHVEFAEPADAATLTRVPGVARVERTGARVTCNLVGPVGPLLDALAGTDVVDVAIGEADLEDVFLSFYGGDDAGA